MLGGAAPQIFYDEYSEYGVERNSFINIVVKCSSRNSTPSANSRSQVPPILSRKGSQVHRLHLHRHRGHLRPHSLHPRIRLHEERYPPPYPDHYYKSNFPTDSDGTPCAYGDNSGYPFVYFPNINDATTVPCLFMQRTCVSLCPQGSEF